MIFEKRQYTDGGPNDRGYVIGYIKADSKEEAMRIKNEEHPGSLGFIQVHKISEETYEQRKKEAESLSKIFKF